MEACEGDYKDAGLVGLRLQRVSIYQRPLMSLCSSHLLVRLFSPDTKSFA